MQLPLSLSPSMTHTAETSAALLTGIGFGFVLERAGFGSALNLVQVFYARDFRVLRVMFTAIVTAMLGLYFLDLTAWMPLGDVGLLPTYVMPQLVGGLLLGAGFIVGGYCPGTSFVAAASGKLDALVFIGGLFGGSMLFALGYGPIEAFHGSTAIGTVLLHEYFHLPSAVIVFGVVLMAVGAFWGTGRIERWVRRSIGAPAR